MTDITTIPMEERKYFVSYIVYRKKPDSLMPFFFANAEISYHGLITGIADIEALNHYLEEQVGKQRSDMEGCMVMILNWRRFENPHDAEKEG